MNLREAAQIALDAMLNFPDDISDDMFESIKALRAALAQPEPETAGYLTNAFGNEWVFTTKKINQHSQPLYTAPPQREWQGLTEEEMLEAENGCSYMDAFDLTLYANNIEAKLKEKNS